jgi:hypothetical protein
MQERRVERGQAVDPAAGEVVERQVVERPAAGTVERPAGQVVTPPAAAAVDQVQATAYDPYAERRRTSWRLVQLIWLLFGTVEGLLAIRFILKLLGANPNAAFASFIYSVSAPFVAPFNNLFGNPASGGSVLELNTLVAMVVYLLVAWLVVKVVWLLAGESRSATRAVTTSTRTRTD